MSAYRCVICGFSEPMWCLRANTQMPPAMVTVIWACSEHLSWACERLQETSGAAEFTVQRAHFMREIQPVT